MHLRFRNPRRSQVAPKGLLYVSHYTDFKVP